MYGEEAASQIVQIFTKYLMEFGTTDIEGAMKLRLQLKNKSRDVSYADALGYYLALKSKVKFLTGDKWFKGLEGVEFVV